MSFSFNKGNFEFNKADFRLSKFQESMLKLKELQDYHLNNKKIQEMLEFRLKFQEIYAQIVQFLPNSI